MNYVINPVHTADLMLDKGFMTYFQNYGEKIWIPIMAWLIKTEEGNVLVDTAPNSAQMVAAGMQTKDVRTIEEALTKYDVKPEDINYLIMTHLHFDHAANAQAFKNAKVIVQKIEYDFSKSPHALFGSMYDEKYIEGMDVELVDGEKEILPGIRVIPVPGHTVGAEAVAVETAQGTAVISGFCSTFDNFKDMNAVVTPGIHMSSLDAFDSAQKIGKLADIIIPQHEVHFAEIAQIPEP